MDIEFFCSHCGQSLAIDESAAGTTVDCPDCNKPAYVPSQMANTPAPVSTPAIPPAPPMTKQTFGQPPRPAASTPAPTAPVTLPGQNLALGDGELVVLQSRMHRAVVALPAIGIAVLATGLGVLFAILQAAFRAMIAGLTHQSAPAHAGPPVLLMLFLALCVPFLLVGAVTTLLVWLARRRTLITLTNRRLIIHQGILSKSTAELVSKQIESVAIRLPWLGRIFGWGTVVVRGTGGGVFALAFLENPDALYKRLQEVLQNSK